MRIVLFSAAALSAGMTLAATPIDGWYSSAFGGYTFMPDNVYVVQPGLLRNHAAYRAGYHVGGRIGFQSNPLRYEGELTYIDANLKGFYINNIRQRGISGDTSALLGMANVYYDFPEMVPAVQPFLGIGIGYGWVEGTLNSTGPFFHSHYNGSNSVFAYQGTAGFTFNFAENYALNIAYRYVGTQKVDNLGKDFQANLGTVGFIYRFNEIIYK